MHRHEPDVDAQRLYGRGGAERDGEHRGGVRLVKDGDRARGLRRWGSEDGEGARARVRAARHPNPNPKPNLNANLTLTGELRPVSVLTIWRHLHLLWLYLGETTARDVYYYYYSYYSYYSYYYSYSTSERPLPETSR